jgi:nucleotide-binding universal stress UspA family protein
MCFLVAIDLTAPSRYAIELSALLARATGLSPLLLHVSEGQPPLRLLADLYALAEPLRTDGSTPRLRTAQGDPASRICEHALAHRARFVVMGTRGHRRDDARATGSVARQVMASCPLPVIAVRPQSLSIPAGHRAPQDVQAIALMDAVGAGDAARGIARFLVQATRGRLLEVPRGTSWRTGLEPAATPDQAPAHLVLSIDPTSPTPAWVEHLLHEEPTPLVLVSEHQRPVAVPDHTAGG